MSRFRTRKALGISAVSLATLTLVPLLAPASRTERLTLLVAAVPLALLFGAIAGWTPAATQWAAPVSGSAHPSAHVALDGHPLLHDHAAVAGANPSSPPRAAQPGQTALGVGVGSVEALQYTLPR